MGLYNSQREEIANLLKEKIRRKLSGYFPESNNMPFHVRLLGQDRMALFSFIQSLNTMLGISVFEQIAVIIATPHFKRAIQQYTLPNNTISKNAQSKIQEIINDLRAARARPDKQVEISKILQVAQTGEMVVVKPARVDLFLESADGTEYYFDLKTSKPNIGEIVGFKQKLLEWVAMRYVAGLPPTQIYTGLAIPYNPYAPQPYDRWTFQGMFDFPNEIKVAEEFWDFLGGNNTYEELLQIFENVGIELRPEIDARFSALRPGNVP
ncbi:MAG: TdeIII family type II restriction endonuclease [Anaerolineales bacterium]